MTARVVRRRSHSDAGVVVIRLGGQLVSTSELHQLFADAPSGHYVDTFAIGDDLHIVLPTGTVAHYGNHHCDPTMWPIDSYQLANCPRAVSADEELTVDYGLISDDQTFRMEYMRRSDMSRRDHRRGLANCQNSAQTLHRALATRTPTPLVDGAS